MTDRFIPIAETRDRAPAPAIPESLEPPEGLLLDRLGRALHDLRISVTDRCNFRCGYCMPREVFDASYRFLPQASLLTFEEIERLARLFAAHGTRKIRLTGGEPLLRRHIEDLVAKLARLRTLDGEPLELTLTTNASLLARKAHALRAAGLHRVTVSLDALDDAIFRRMNDADFPVTDVLDGIDAARAAGLGPIKVNMVVRRGINDGQILPMARHFRGSGVILRFIEYMDVGSSNGWRLDEVVPGSEVIARIGASFPVEPIGRHYTGEVAECWRYLDGAGEIGVITSVTQPFCSDCSRARLSTDGRLYTCLFASEGHDLRALLRTGATDLMIANALGQVWRRRQDRYSELRSEASARRRKIEMSYIGG
ncbi:MAG: GTP 3',8-cyclase MoaA [Burkholderiaceae bacterium]